MRKIIKYLLVVMICLLLVGCNKVTVRDEINAFFNQYNNLSVNVIDDIDNVVNNEDLTDKQKDKYRSILKRQYQDLKYQILREEYDKDKAYVYVEIRVYDLNKSINEANETLVNNGNDFLDESGNYSVEKFMDYKLDLMKDTHDYRKYDMVIELVLDENNKYKIKSLSEENLKKIHGIYDEELM